MTGLKNQPRKENKKVMKLSNLSHVDNHFKFQHAVDPGVHNPTICNGQNPLGSNWDAVPGLKI